MNPFTSTRPELQSLLGERLSVAGDVLASHSKDASHHRPRPPQAVAFPNGNPEVAALVEICRRHRLPVIPFGKGTAVEGGVVAVSGGLSVDLSRMNAILEVNAGDLDARVQAGVTRKQLNRHLAEAGTGLHFPVDPGADASLGGMAATRASGTEAVGYGTMRENVLGLTVVTADGRLVRTGGRARKSAAGYDLTRLLVGSEGTLGIITEVCVRLARLPEAIAAAVCPFPGIEAATAAVIELISAGIRVARSELLDEIQIDAVNRYAGFDHPVTPTLFLEFHGSEQAVAEEAAAAGAIAARHGGADFRWATEAPERERLWQARHDGYYACLALRPGSVGYVTDVCVPVSRLADCILRAKQDLAGSELIAPVFGHVGDGNFHVVYLLDPQRPEELEEARRLGDRLIAHALELGGTCSGEHGIGIGKLDALEREFGEGVELMRDIKRALDPDNIMNPGKVVRL